MKLLTREYVFTFVNPKKSREVNDWQGFGAKWSLNMAKIRAKMIAPLEQQEVYIGKAVYIEIPIPFSIKSIRMGNIDKIKKYPLYEDDKDEQ